MQMYRRILFAWLPLAAMLLLVVTPVLSGAALAATKTAQAKTGSQTTATDKPQDLSTAVTQSYSADPSVQTGMIVRLKDKDPKTVVPLEQADAKKILGIVVPATNATIVLAPETFKQQQVLVAHTGHFSVLVSNQNGPIKPGDFIAISALSGIGMKAGPKDEETIGKAGGSFSGTANVISKVDLKDSLGRKATVAIGRVPLDIAIIQNPLFAKPADFIPDFMAKAASTVSNKPVSAARIYLGIAILGVAAFVTGNIVYSGVHSGMIAVGRNPLSKKSIIRSLIQTVIAGLIVFIAGVIGVYLLLKL